MSVDLEALKRRVKATGTYLPYYLQAEVIAALEHGECMEMALAELVKRASDPDIEATAAGARIMLDEAIREARILLKGPGDV